MIRCPICKSNKYVYNAYEEEYWGSIITVEQDGYCPRCGYIIKQAYSPVFEAFCDTKKGYKCPNGTYIQKNTRKHKRYRRRSKIKLQINPEWVSYI